MKTRAVFLAMAGSSAMLLACGNWLEPGNHFNYQKLDYGTPPSQFRLFSSERVGTIIPDYDYASHWRREELATELVRKIRLREEAGRPFEARGYYERLPENAPSEEHNAKFRLALLDASSAHRRLEPVKRLLARSGKLERPPGLWPGADELPEPLRPYLLYAIASKAFDSKAFAHAAGLYGTVADRYSKFEFHEAARIMVGRCLVLDYNPAPDDSDFVRANRHMTALLRERPATRFRQDALGIMARSYLLRGKAEPALQIYRRLAEEAKSQREVERAYPSLAEAHEGLGQPHLAAITYLKAIEKLVWAERKLSYAISAREILSTISASDAGKFAQGLRKDPQALSVYLQYRLENWDWKIDHTNLVQLAEAALPNAEGTPYKAALHSRAAQYAFQIYDLTRVRKHGLAAARDPRARLNDAARGLYLVASAENRSGNPHAALRTYEELVTKYPKSYVSAGAYEAMAALYDHTGQLDKALDALWVAYPSRRYGMPYYRHAEEVSYMVDVRMTPGQLAEFVRKRPKHPQRDLLVYSLAIRHLREKSWAKARATLNRLGRAKRLELSQLSYYDAWRFDGDSVYDPLVTVNALERLHKQVDAAKGDEAKAAAMYELASYYYNKKPLLLYNAALWQGSRNHAISHSWDWTQTGPSDRNAVRRHVMEHECTLITLQICEDILEKFPNSKVAPQAAYRGACAAERFGLMNPYTRMLDEKKGYTGRALELFEIVYTRWPDHKLAHDAKKYQEVFRNGQFHW